MPCRNGRHIPSTPFPAGPANPSETFKFQLLPKPGRPGAASPIPPARRASSPPEIPLTDLFAARTQFAISMAFHIIFAVYGIGLPLLMVIAEALWLKTEDRDYLDMARRWARATGVLFAIGAVSGTVIAFELGLLWPEFMKLAGPVIGMPFSMEGFAFFVEAIFLAVYLYAWDKVNPKAHWLSGIAVAISSVLSGIFVVDANSWMNSPRGLVLLDGTQSSVHPLLAMLNPFASTEIPHMVLAAYIAVGFSVAAIYAFSLLRTRAALGLARKAFVVSFAVAAWLSPVQLLSGDFSARAVGALQPEKLAAMESLFHTRSCAPEIIAGIPDVKTQTVRYGLPIPCGLSFLLKFNPNAVVEGLDAFAPPDRPDPLVVHLSFQLMLWCGFFFVFLAVWAVVVRLRRGALVSSRGLLAGTVAAGMLSLIAIEAGWFVTEVGRQPWVAYRLIRTAQAMTPATSVVMPSLVVFSLIYLFLAALVIWLLLGLASAAHPAQGEGTFGGHRDP